MKAKLLPLSSGTCTPPIEVNEGNPMREAIRWGENNHAPRTQRHKHDIGNFSL
jgi:hypothetical protein